MRQELFFISLWRHECERVFEDKLVNYADKGTFKDMLNKVTKDKFKGDLGFEDEELDTQLLFADFMRKDEIDEYGDLVEEAPFVYEACSDIEAIRKICYDKLEMYNEKN